MAFDWPQRVQELLDNPRSNRAIDYGVKIEPKENANWLVSVYHLSPDENSGGNYVYYDVYDRFGERQIHRAVLWGWEGQSSLERAETRPLYADKPMNEIPALVVGAGQVVELEIAGGDKVVKLHTGHDPDELKEDGVTYGNTRFHHSFLVVFQEEGYTSPEPAPTPIPPGIDILDPPVVLEAKYNSDDHLVVTIQIFKEKAS